MAWLLFAADAAHNELRMLIRYLYAVFSFASEDAQPFSVRILDIFISNITGQQHKAAAT